MYTKGSYIAVAKMAGRVSVSDGSEGSASDYDGPWSDEEDFCDGDVFAKLRCNAITKLNSDIAAVLKNEIKTVLSKALSESLIGEDMHNKGMTSQSDPQLQATQFLGMVKAQIVIKQSFYSTFLEILRSTTALEHLADRIEKEVNRLEKREERKKRKSAGSSAGGGMSGGGGGGGGDDGRFYGGVAKWDLHCDDDDDKTMRDDEGFQSDQCVSATIVGSNVAETPPDRVASMRSSTNNFGEEPVQNQTRNSDILISPCDPQVEMITPQQTSEGGEGEGADVLSDTQSEVQSSKETMGEKATNDSVGAGGSVFVFQSQQTTQGVVAERNALQSRLKAMESQLNEVKARHDKKLSRKEEELSHRMAEIERKSRDIESLKEAHESKVKQLEEKHEEKMAQLRSDQWKIGEKLQKAKEEKVALEREKQAQKQLEHFEEEKRKYKAEKEQLELNYRDKIQKLESIVEKEKSEAKLKEEFLSMREEKADEIAALKDEIDKLKEKNFEARMEVQVQREQMETQKERAKNEVQREQIETQKERAEKEKALLEADLRKEILLKEQTEKMSKLLRPESVEGQPCIHASVYACLCVLFVMVVASSLFLYLYHPLSVFIIMCIIILM